jgi:hypothetical protein
VVSSPVSKVNSKMKVNLIMQDQSIRCQISFHVCPFTLNETQHSVAFPVGVLWCNR